MFKLGFSFLAIGLFAVGCASAQDPSEEDAAAGADLIKTAGSSKSFVAKGTGYFPDSSSMEGGFTDRKGAKLRTLQQYLAGQADYVSVAMDANAFSYGQRLRIHELNTKYGKDIPFKVVDTGGAFTGKGTSRIDICTANSKAASDSTINGQLHIDAVAANDNQPPAPTGTPTPAPLPTTTPTPKPTKPTTTPRPVPTTSTFPTTPSFPPPSDPTPTLPDFPDDPETGSSGGGTSCSSDGACNPGNDGSGLICVGGQCVPGCHSDANCPGVTTCQSGQCQ
jgi:hypothetical protein